MNGASTTSSFTRTGTATGTATATATAELSLPTVPSSKYRVVAELGRGGMATAFLALLRGPAGFSKLVVVKRLHPNHASEPEFLRMFLEEARLAARIDHPNVVHTSEVASDGENYFIAMEYLDGQSFELASRKARAVKDAREGFPIKFQLHVLAQVLAGLHFAHELADYDGAPLGLVHRDMSPHNVMVTYEGHVKIVDFGIAKAASSTGDTSTGVIKGKAQYMPAEQFEGKDIDCRADVFAVGVMFWQALTGVKLWKDKTDAEIYRAIVTGEIPPPRSVVPDVHPELEGICMRALAVKKEDRYATAADMQAAIEDIAARQPELRATPRELGAFIAELFVETRARVRATVEAHLAENQLDGTLQAAAVSASFSASAAPTSQTPRSRRARRLAWSAAAFVLALASGVGAMVARRTPAAPPAMANVIVAVEPRDAKVVVDDTTLVGDPPTTILARDGRAHVVRASAPGYLPRAESVVLDAADVHMALVLAREPQAELAPATSGGAGDRLAPAPPAPARKIKPRPPEQAAAKVGNAVPVPAASIATATPEDTESVVPPVPTARRVAIDPNNPYEGR